MTTHAISFFSSDSNNCRFLFFNTRFLGESGCKDTTIFQTGKIFFQKKSHRGRNRLSLSAEPRQKKSGAAAAPPAKGRGRRRGNAKFAPPGPKKRENKAKTAQRAVLQRYTPHKRPPRGAVINRPAAAPRGTPARTCAASPYDSDI